MVPSAGERSGRTHDDKPASASQAWPDSAPFSTASSSAMTSAGVSTASSLNILQSPKHCQAMTCPSRRRSCSLPVHAVALHLIHAGLLLPWGTYTDRFPRTRCRRSAVRRSNRRTAICQQPARIRSLSAIDVHRTNGNAALAGRNERSGTWLHASAPWATTPAPNWSEARRNSTASAMPDSPAREAA